MAKEHFHVTLDADLALKAREVADEQALSLSALFQRALDRFFIEEERRERAAVTTGKNQEERE